MKQLSILCLGLGLCIMGCSQKEPINTEIIIAGKLENTESKEIKLYFE